MKKHPREFLLVLLTLVMLSCQTVSIVPTTPIPASSPVEIMDPKGVTMRLISAGDFVMGSNTGQESAMPGHTVALPAYYMDVYEVTRARYQECVIAGGCSEVKNVASIESFYREPNFPMSAVDWDMAGAYCAWRGARLPSEAEWEKAARGTDGRTYPWGEEYDSTYVQIEANSLNNVGMYEKGKSPYGMYDMAGSVWEWTSDPLTAYPGNQGDQSYYRETDRVLRGGSWDHPDRTVLTTWFRFASFTGDSSGYTGFRCARDATPQ
jgi:formylglycine-generating enzyme required for sulfatase activity